MGVEGSKTRHACSHSSRPQTCSPSPRASHRTLGLRLDDHGLLCCVVVQIQLAGSVSQAAYSRGASEGAHSGVTGSLAEERVHPCLGWEDVMTRCPCAAGTRAFKKLRKQPLSEQRLHWRRAHPGLTFKKPNCLLQREKATSCHRPCSGKNVSGLAVAVRAVSAQVGAGAHQ